MPLSPGARIGVYEVLAPLGAGGMGEVYRARDPRLGRDVAIKCLPPAFAADPDRLMRFEREARTLASLNHQHIAQVYGLEETGSTQALVMELVDGEDLSARIARGPLPLDEALPIAQQIAQALEAAHAIGIVHRDLKPANVKVRHDGAVKVLDFGLAKAVEGTGGAGPAGAAADALLNSPTITSPALTLGGVILGTAAYMSPEQAKGKLVDKRADIWAFGCVLYEMLTGRRAFEGEDVSDTLAAILRGDPDWSALPPLPPALTLLLRRCLERDYRRRVGDMAAVRFVLEDLTAAPPPADDGHTARRGHADGAGAVVDARRRVQLRVVAPLVAITIVASVLAAVAWSRAWRPAPRLPVARFALPLPQGEVLSMTRRMTSLSPDGRSLLYITGNQLNIRRLSLFQPEPLPGVDLGQALTSPVFSPDGAWIAYHTGAQGAVKRVSTRGGAAQRVCDVSLPVTISWEAPGILLGMGGAGASGGVLLCNPAGGAPQPLVREQNGEAIISPQMLTDDLVLFTSARVTDDAATRWEKAEIVIVSRASGTREVAVRGGSDARYLSTGHLIYRSGGILYAVPFDVSTRQVRGEAVPAIEGVARSSAGPTQMSISESGSIVYMPGSVGASTSERQLTIVDRSGTVTNVPLSPGPFVQVRVSPDGKQVALASEGAETSIWIYALDGRTALRRLTLSSRNISPVWSPDGQWIAFQSDRGGDRGIYKQRADGVGNAERLTTAAAGEAHVPESWSPDARHLAYAVQTLEPQLEYKLHVVSLADGKSVPFGDVTSVQPLGATFSRDGRWIAYARTSEAVNISAPDRGVFVQPFPATGTVLQAPRQIVDFHPMWTHDGKELVFVASTTARQMAAVPVSVAGGTLAFGPPSRFPARVTGDRLSSEPRSFDLLPDGRVIGLLTPSEAVAGSGFSELRVVMNWFDELLQRVPVK